MFKEDSVISDPFFVVGFPRSGTTFLSELLNRHSNISIPSETRFFREFYLESKTFSLSRAGCAQKVKYLLGNRWFSDTPMSNDEALHELRGEGRCNYSDLFVAFLKANAKKYKKTRYGEKTPIHLIYVEEILRLYPKAKIICIIRDCRDAVLSIMRTPWRNGSLMRYAADWNYRAVMSLKFTKLHPESFKIVRYEDLLAEPKKTVIELCEFIGEDFEDSQLSPSKDTGIVPVWEEGWKKKALEEVDSTRSRTWERHEDQRLVSFIGWLVRRNLIRFGYDVPQVKFRGIDKLVLWSYFLIYNPFIYSGAYRLRNVFRYFYFVSGARNILNRGDIVDRLRR